MKKNTFYVTTPIYYPSGDLHIGHVYTTVLADVLTRYKLSQNYEVFFVTGSDEHGQKIEKKAKELNMEPQKYVDMNVKKFKNLWKMLKVEYSKFTRTTDIDHIKSVQKIFSLMFEQKLVYLDKYIGNYCISCEEFLTISQIENGKCLICGSTPINNEEETYMLKVTKYKDFLKNLMNSDYLIPSFRRNEMINSFIDNNLEDLSVTRVNFKWGVPVLENPKHVLYVWIDALSNYITGLGIFSNDEKNFNKFWNDDTEIVHIVGKEITRFFSIYWPVILKSLNLRMPNKLLSHGWILSEGMKMSKSLGNVVDPINLIDKYGSDTIRFYVSFNLPYINDGDISDDLIIESYNINLANNIGNLASRVANMIITYFDGDLNDVKTNNIEIRKNIKIKYENYCNKFNEYDISSGIKEVLDLASYCNKCIELKKPWEMKNNNNIIELNDFLFELRNAIAWIGLMLKPVLVDSYNLFAKQFGFGEEINYENLINGNIKYNKIKEKLIFFKRFK